MKKSLKRRRFLLNLAEVCLVVALGATAYTWFMGSLFLIEYFLNNNVFGINEILVILIITMFSAVVMKLFGESVTAIRNKKMNLESPIVVLDSYKIDE